MSQTSFEKNTNVDALPALDSLTASIVARQSRTDDGSMSVPDQIAAAREWCARQVPPVAVGHVYVEESVSGKRKLSHRPGLREAVADVEAGRSQIVLTAYFDRVARNVETFREAQRRVEAVGGAIETLDFGRASGTTPIGRLTSGFLALIFEFFAEQTGEKTMVSKQRNIDNGVPPFPHVTPAYRRRDDGRLEQDPEGAPLILEAIQMRLASEPASYATIARWLAGEGVVGGKGKPYTPGGVEQLFASKLLVGEIHFGDFRPNLHAIDEPLIDHATYRRLNETKATRGTYAKSERLLARLGILVCGTCGSRMTVSTTGGKYVYYRCGDRLCERPAVIAADAAEAVVVEKTIQLTAELRGRGFAADEIEAARLARVDAEEKLDGAIRTLSALADRPATRETLDELQAQADRLVAHHERLLAFATPDRTLSTAADWERLSLDERRDLVRAVVVRASVAPGSARGPRADASRVVVEGRGEVLPD